MHVHNPKIRKWGAVIAVLTVSLLAALGAGNGSAAAYVGEAEAEGGGLVGQAVLVDDESASGGKAVAFGGLVQANAAYNTTVHYDTPGLGLVPAAFSGTISTYGKSVATSEKQRTQLGDLALGMYRLPLRWNGGAIISSAGGGPVNISGDTWVSSIKSYGGVPMVVIGGAHDNDFTPAEAASLVRHFNGEGGSGSSRIDYWIVGNEPNNGGMGMEAYCNLFNATYDAMKAVDASIRIAGPAWSYYDAGRLQSFLQCAGSRVDIIDYHHYAMGESYLDNATALSRTVEWEDEIRQVRSMINNIVPARAQHIEIQVGEYNWSWRTENGYPGYNGDDRFYEPVAAVWAASVAGHIAKAGGRGFQYSDQNGALGLTFEYENDAARYGRSVNDQMPIYHGLQMFSGGKLFRKFGDKLVQATTTLPNVEVFASDNQRNIVMINKSPNTQQSAAIQTKGVGRVTADVWQTNKDAPFSPPVRKAVLSGNGGLSYNLPPYSVTTFVLR